MFNVWYWWIGIVCFTLGMRLGEWQSNNNWIATSERKIANFCRDRFWYVITEREWREKVNNVTQCSPQKFKFPK